MKRIFPDKRSKLGQSAKKVGRVAMSEEGSGEEGSSSGEEQVSSPSVLRFPRSPRPTSPEREQMEPSDDEELAGESEAARLANQIVLLKKKAQKGGQVIMKRLVEARSQGRAEFLSRWTARLNELAQHYDKKPKARYKAALADSTPDERTLARIAWTLEKLKSTRVCVAVLLTKNNRLYIYANTADDDLIGHLGLLKQIASGEADHEAYANVLEKLQKAAVSELRTGKTDDAMQKKKDKAERRLNKVLNFFKRYPAITLVKHEPRTEDKHAEMRAADAVHADMDAADDATHLQGAVGISKLCCGKCALALDALERTKDITFKVLGAHLKTYDTQAGWPVPNFLEQNDEAMKSFLGEDAFTLYKVDRQYFLNVIKSEKLDSTSFQQTDHYSSEEEAEGWLPDEEEEDDRE